MESSEGAPVPAHEKSTTIGEQIQSLLDADQKDRDLLQNDPDRASEIAKRDEQRLEDAKRMITNTEITDPSSLHNLSFIFQHGSTVEDFKIAQELALKAIDAGLPPEVSLYPQATDRLMLNKQLQNGTQESELRQKFGTQVYNFKIPPVDGTATEEEMEKFKPMKAELFLEKNREVE